jgi:hypothetical protein
MPLPLSFRAVALLAYLASALAVPLDAARADSPFRQLSGSWSGSGQVRFEKGTSEPISCKAYYTSKSEGADLTLAIRCASSSYKIEMRANLSQQGGRISGHWEERTFNAQGAISGRSAGSGLSLAISGAVSGTMSVQIGEAKQRIDIKTTGTGLAGVSITLQRA